jgi:protein-S-isoprenylcysteine O-methyltransferase Ste14
MELYGRYSKSIPQKVLIITLETASLAFSYFLLLGNGVAWLGLSLQAGAVWRRALVFAFNCVVYARMWLTITYLLKRRIPLEEAISVPLAFALYYVGYAFLAYQAAGPFDLLDALGIALFLLGSFLNTFSELQLDRWKKDPAHKGKLYTEGLFRHSMHINYFGDLLWVTGYALVTHNWLSALIPLFLFSFFAFYNIPKLDQHLAQKYGAEFEGYRRRTKRFIPYLY